MRLRDGCGCLDGLCCDDGGSHLRRRGRVRGLGRRRKERTAHVAHSAGHAIHEFLQLHSRITQSLALDLEVLLQMIDVAQQKVASCQQRLHFVLRTHALILYGASRVEARVFDRLGSHHAGAVEHSRCLVASLCCDPVGLCAGLYDRCIGGALGQQQRATDHVGVTTVAVGGRCLALAARGLLRHLLQFGDSGACPGLHRSRLVLSRLNCCGDLRTKGFNFVRVVTLLDGLEAGAANRLWADVHAAMLGASGGHITPTLVIRPTRYRTLPSLRAVCTGSA